MKLVWDHKSFHDASSRIDGASDPDAEPDERATDGHAGRLVQRVPQVLRHVLHGGGVRTHRGVSVGILTSFFWATVGKAALSLTSNATFISTVRMLLGSNVVLRRASVVTKQLS